LRNQVSVRRYTLIRDGDWRIDKSSGIADGAVATRLGYVYVFLTSPFFEAAISQVQLKKVGKKARFNERDQKRYDTKRDEVRKRLGTDLSDKCRDFLTKAGLTIKDILDAVNLQNAYDGERSTISMSDAGYYKNGALSNFDKAKRDAFLNQSVGDFVKRNAKAATMLFPGGVEVNSVAQRSDVYFQIDYQKGFLGIGKGYGENSGLNQVTILHEALHSLTGLQDIELYKLLTGNTTESGAVASAGISQALKDNDCVE
jgi:hypothetical protein